MASRDRRQKASDVFGQANFVFSEKADFATAFPTIESATVEVIESDYGNDKHRYWSPSQGEFIDCSNTLCYNGGVSVGAVLRQMVREGASEGVFNKLCQGYEGSPKGRRNTASAFGCSPSRFGSNTWPVMRRCLTRRLSRRPWLWRWAWVGTGTCRNVSRVKSSGRFRSRRGDSWWGLLGRGRGVGRIRGPRAADIDEGGWSCSTCSTREICCSRSGGLADSLPDEFRQVQQVG